jgi:hypothetical protein
MFATSFRYAKSLGTLRTIETLINALRKPDLPRLGEHYTQTPRSVQENL